MKEELLEVVRLLQFLARRRGIIAGVVEPRAVFGPRRAGELDPLQMVGQILARIHITNVPLGPVRPCLRQTVGQARAVFAEGIARQSDRAVFGQRVRVQQHTGRSVQAFGDIQNALVLQAVIAPIEVPPALPVRHPIALIVPQFREPVPQRGAGGDLLQKAERQRVLRLHPRTGFRRIGVFEQRASGTDRPLRFRGNYRSGRTAGRRGIQMGCSYPAVRRRAARFLPVV